MRYRITGILSAACALLLLGVVANLVEGGHAEKSEVVLRMHNGTSLVGKIGEEVEDGFHLRTVDGARVVKWRELKSKTAMDIKRSFVKQGTALGHVEIGVFSLRMGWGGVANREFRKALRLDSSLAETIQTAKETAQPFPPLQTIESRKPSEEDNQTPPEQEESIESDEGEVPPDQPGEEHFPDEVEEDDETESSDEEEVIDIDEILEEDDPAVILAALEHIKDESVVLALQRKLGERITEEIGITLHTIETDHYILHVGVTGKLGRDLAKNCEKLYKEFLRIFHVEENEDTLWFGKCMIFFFNSHGDFSDFAVEVARSPGAANSGGYYTTLGRTVYIVIPKYQQLNKRGQRTRVMSTLVHEGAHAFLGHYRGTSDVPRWVHEGMAQYFEFWNYRLGTRKTDPQKAAYRKDMKRLVRNNRHRGFERMMSRQNPISGMDGAGYAQAWSMVDMMISASSDKFVRFVKVIKAEKSHLQLQEEDPDLTYEEFMEILYDRQKKALKESFGWTPKKFEKRWKRRVKKSY